MSTFVNPLTYLILLALHGLAWLYAYRSVRPTRQHLHNHGQTALFVVIGDAAVALAVVLIVAANGPVDWLNLAVILFMALAAGGIPMIWEYIDDHTSSQQANDARAYTAEIQRLLVGED